MNIIEELKINIKNTAPYIIKKIDIKDVKEWIYIFKDKSIIQTDDIEKLKGIIVLALGYNLEKNKEDRKYMKVSSYYYFSNKYYHEINKVLEKLIEKGFKIKKLNNQNLKSLAVMSGVGYYGKNTLVHNEAFGSQMVLYAFGVYNEEKWDDINYKYSDCEDCRICIESCPNQALKDFKLNRERCIRNYTLEGVYIPKEIRELLDNRLIGCDICQEKCPKNEGKNSNLEKMKIIEKELLLPETYINNWEKGLKKYIQDLSKIIGSNYARTNRVLSQSIISSGNLKKKSMTDNLKCLEKHQDKNIVEYSRWAVDNIKSRSDNFEY